MPKAAYSEEDRERIRTDLVRAGLELMAKQGIQHTTVEQIYKKVGIYNGAHKTVKLKNPDLQGECGVTPVTPFLFASISSAE